MKQITLGGGEQAATVDDQDFELVSRHLWHVHKDPSGGRYAVRRWREDGKRRVQYMHCLIMGRRGIDHADRDGLNNQRSNLRPATQSQNMANTRKRPGSSSQYKGVAWFGRTGKWTAHIQVNGHGLNLGYYTDEADAARAYDTAAVAAFGEFARINFPTRGAALCRSSSRTAWSATAAAPSRRGS